jgi:hypothetical protein
LTGRLDDDDWQECQERAVDCLERAPTLAVHNVSPVPSLCGPIGLVRQPPVPWAWSGADREITMLSKVVRLEASC